MEPPSLASQSSLLLYYPLAWELPILSNWLLRTWGRYSGLGTEVRPVWGVRFAEIIVPMNLVTSCCWGLYPSPRAGGSYKALPSFFKPQWYSCPSSIHILARNTQWRSCFNFVLIYLFQMESLECRSPFNRMVAWHGCASNVWTAMRFRRWTVRRLGNGGATLHHAGGAPGFHRLDGTGRGSARSLHRSAQ